MGKQRSFQILRQAAGFSLPMAIAGLALVTITLTTFYPMMSRYLSQSKQYLNARAELAAAETSIRLILTSPISYRCTAIGGVPNCSFLNSATSKLAGVSSPAAADIMIATLRRIGCEIGKNCQLHISNGGTIFNEPGSVRVRFSYLVRLTGVTEMSTDIDVPLPMTTLLNKFTPCPGALVGIGSDGRSICKDINSPRAGIGQFISAIDPVTYEVTFSNVPAEVRDCTGPNQFILNYSWAGGQRYRVSCGDRLNPGGLASTVVFGGPAKAASAGMKNTTTPTSSTVGP